MKKLKLKLDIYPVEVNYFLCKKVEIKKCLLSMKKEFNKPNVYSKKVEQIGEKGPNFFTFSPNLSTKRGVLVLAIVIREDRPNIWADLDDILVHENNHAREIIERALGLTSSTNDEIGSYLTQYLWHNSKKLLMPSEK